MTIDVAKSIVGYFNSSNQIFKNRIKTTEVIEAETLLKKANEESLSYIHIPPPPRKSRAKMNMQELQDLISEEMGIGYTLIFINPYPNCSKRVYYLQEDSTGKKFCMGKVVSIAAKLWNDKTNVIINFFKQNKAV